MPSYILNIVSTSGNSHDVSQALATLGDEITHVSAWASYPSPPGGVLWEAGGIIFSLTLLASAFLPSSEGVAYTVLVAYGHHSPMPSPPRTPCPDELTQRL